MSSPLTPKVRFRGVPLTPPIDCADPASWIAERIYQMGADQELEACCALMEDWGLDGNDLMECRRPKPPSLRQQALRAFDRIEYGQSQVEDFATIRRALKALPDDTI